LLATPDAVRITTPVLPRETMERVLEILRRDVSEEKVRVDTPTQNLESYFLDVVAKARERAAETSGAVGGAKVAAYLKGEAEAKPATDKILERFAAPAAVPEAPTIAREQPATPAVNETRLAALSQPAEPLPAEKPTEPAAEPTKAADLGKANEKLSSLLGKKAQ
jgi:hypothetical protein